MTDLTHWALFIFGLSIGVFVLFLFWWFIWRMEQRIGVLVSREVAGIIAQIAAFREDAVAEARLAVNSARTSHMLLIKVEKRVDDHDRRLQTLEDLASTAMPGAGSRRS
jgi:hypothetical protein